MHIFSDSGFTCDYCGANTTCVSTDDDDDFEDCVCKKGYVGNPYKWLGDVDCYIDPCEDWDCGAFAFCEETDDGEADCVCPPGGLYIEDPKDPDACVLDPCAQLSADEIAARHCTRNIEKQECECDRGDNDAPPAGADEEDGFYGPWAEWSECPQDCQWRETDLPVRRGNDRTSQIFR